MIEPVTSSERSDRIPYGVWFVRKVAQYSPSHCISRPHWLGHAGIYRISIILLTYTLYVTYHLARRPLGVVKNVLAQTNCSGLTPPTGHSEWLLKNESWCAWKPFDHNSKEQFSGLDFTYRFSYAVGMIVFGHIAERSDLRRFLTFGMLFAGFFSIFNGMAYFWEIHSFSFFVVAQLFGGLFQGTGWPCVVALMGNWFGRRRRGFIFGVWNSHTSVGNILGSVIAGIWVNGEWGYSFIVPGFIIMAGGIMAFLFVVVKPEDVGLPHPDQSEPEVTSANTVPVLNSSKSNMSISPDFDDPPGRIMPDSMRHELMPEKKAISPWRALKIPGVVEYALSLFFAKFVYYTFFFWLPVYIKEITHAGNEFAGDLSAVFDAGGIIGGILAGTISDATGGSATVCGVMFLLAIPSLYLMVLYAGSGASALIALLVITGLFVNGPYALITTAVSADLGSRPSLVKNTRALSTVAGTIDGMGSLGSAFGPLFAGLLAVYGWYPVFYLLMAAEVVALLCLTRLIYREIREWLAKYRSRHSSDAAGQRLRTGSPG